MTPHTEFSSNDMLHLLDDLEKCMIDTGANTSSNWIINRINKNYIKLFVLCSTMNMLSKKLRTQSLYIPP